ncbi:hypothetical protein DFJ73DRAFT_955732 [Zopfochytrium polystomum]|nr:hypothetical protein DFJ73DRAFT_955732 [Zopfochytrium polystomum]
MVRSFQKWERMEGREGNCLLRFIHTSLNGDRTLDQDEVELEENEINVAAILDIAAELWGSATVHYRFVADEPLVRLHSRTPIIRHIKSGRVKEFYVKEKLDPQSQARRSEVQVQGQFNTPQEAETANKAPRAFGAKEPDLPGREEPHLPQDADSDLSVDEVVQLTPVDVQLPPVEEQEDVQLQLNRSCQDRRGSESTHDPVQLPKDQHQYESERQLRKLRTNFESTMGWMPHMPVIATLQIPVRVTIGTHPPQQSELAFDHSKVSSIMTKAEGDARRGNENFSNVRNFEKFQEHDGHDRRDYYKAEFKQNVHTVHKESAAVDGIITKEMDVVVSREDSVTHDSFYENHWGLFGVRHDPRKGTVNEVVESKTTQDIFRVVAKSREDGKPLETRETKQALDDGSNIVRKEQDFATVEKLKIHIGEEGGEFLPYSESTKLGVFSQSQTKRISDTKVFLPGVDARYTVNRQFIVEGDYARSTVSGETQAIKNREIHHVQVLEASEQKPLCTVHAKVNPESNTSDSISVALRKIELKSAHKVGEDASIDQKLEKPESVTLQAEGSFKASRVTTEGWQTTEIREEGIALLSKEVGADSVLSSAKELTDEAKSFNLQKAQRHFVDAKQIKTSRGLFVDQTETTKIDGGELTGSATKSVTFSSTAAAGIQGAAALTTHAVINAIANKENIDVVAVRKIAAGTAISAAGSHGTELAKQAGKFAPVVEIGLAMATGAANSLQSTGNVAVEGAVFAGARVAAQRVAGALPPKLASKAIPLGAVVDVAQSLYNQRNELKTTGDILDRGSEAIVSTAASQFAGAASASAITSLVATAEVAGGVATVASVAGAATLAASAVAFVLVSTAVGYGINTFWSSIRKQYKSSAEIWRDRKRLEKLASELGIRSDQSVERTARLMRTVWLQIHPDKVAPARKAEAEEEFKKKFGDFQEFLSLQARLKCAADAPNGASRHDGQDEVHSKYLVALVDCLIRCSDRVKETLNIQSWGSSWNELNNLGPLSEAVNQQMSGVQCDVQILGQSI